MTRRILIAAALAIIIYAVGAGVGLLLYATDTIATGPTHNDCEGYRDEIARERGIDEQDVPQEEIKARTEACLATHQLDEREALRTEFLIGAAWPAGVVAVMFILWPWWSAILHRQEEHERATEGEGDKREAGMA